MPEIASGAAGELEALRTAARAAVDEVCAGATRIGVLVPGTVDAPLRSWRLDGFGLPVGQGQPVELPVAVAGWLLADRPAQVVGTGASASSLRQCDAVLVMGDGSSTRTEKAPGYSDPRALPFDESVLAAISAGDPVSLAGLDPELASAVGAAGAEVWRRLSTQVDEVASAHISAVDDRYGVLYFVATWLARWAAPA